MSTLYHPSVMWMCSAIAIGCFVWSWRDFNTQATERRRVHEQWMRDETIKDVQMEALMKANYQRQLLEYQQHPDQN